MRSKVFIGKDKAFYLLFGFVGEFVSLAINQLDTVGGRRVVGG